MTTIPSFVSRLKRVGIEVSLVRNWPWVYLDEVNGKKVTDKFMANHGFTVFFMATKVGEKDHITDIAEVFKQIRKML